METRQATRLKRTYWTFLGSGALALLASGATLLLEGGWQATLAAVAVLAGSGCLISLMSLFVTGERLASPARGRAYPRAIPRPAPAAVARPEAAPEQLARLQPRRPTPRPQSRVSSTPS